MCMMHRIVELLKTKLGIIFSSSKASVSMLLTLSHQVLTDWCKTLLIVTSISANTDGPRDAASRKIDYIAHRVQLPGNERWLIANCTQTEKFGYYQIFER